MSILEGDRAIDRSDGFCAGGSIPRPAAVAYPSDARRVRLLAEFGFLYVVTPLLMRLAVFHYHVPLFYALPPILAMMIAMFTFDSSFDLKREMLRGFTRATLRSILLIFAAGCGLVAALVALEMPDHLFALTAERPGMWLKIMTLYPFTSVLAQEFFYRVLFFHRFGPLFPNRAMLIVANAFVFALGHAIFGNWIAVAGTFAVGLLLAWRYQRTRSFWAVWFEHVLWGWLAFTIGLGAYFFTGVKNPAW